MFDWNEIKVKANELLADADKKIKQYTPEAFSKEKKFVNAIVLTMVLMTIADKKVATSEVISSMDMLREIEEIQKLEMVQEAIELFEMHLEKVSSILNNNIKFTIETSKMLGDIAKIKDYSEYIPMIKNLVDFIANADGDIAPEEEEMKQKIIEAIS